VGDEVVFHFGDEREIRSSGRVPERGERLMHRGVEWEITAVEAHSHGRVTCTVHPLVASSGEEDLVAHLLERVQSELDRIAWNLPEPRDLPETTSSSD
jgi:hypothetical protein